jgi:hypothetical protein
MLASLPIRLSTLLILTAACADPREPGGPTSPPPVSPPAQPPANGCAGCPSPVVNPPPPPFPPLSRAGEIYLGPDSLYDESKFGGPWWASRYVLYDAHEFALQLSSFTQGFLEYRGQYSRVDSSLTFSFDGDSRWATGIMRGDSLTVQYSLIAQLTDFVDGVYVRSPP